MILIISKHPHPPTNHPVQVARQVTSFCSHIFDVKHNMQTNTYNEDKN